ncbi:MAG: hypothetical protein AAFX58_03320 [Pseudomonadota bacterium]
MNLTAWTPLREFGDSFRACMLPGNADGCRDGVLTTRIPKTARDTSKTVKIPVD